MISMSTVNSIRQLRREGHSITEIAKKTGVSRDTVYKYLDRDDFSPKLPTVCPRSSVLDPYKECIDRWLEEDARSWRKQRHTARRIWQRLKEEFGANVSETTVSRYVKKQRAKIKAASEMFLSLDWAPGEAQADFGEADFYVMGTRQRMKYFVMSFPYSNVGLAQVFQGETAECVCEGLKEIFDYIGGVPTRIVFDNATGIGRKICKTIRTTNLFAAFAAHYDFAFSFCNQNAGHEKGNVERKVGYIRQKLFVPVARIYSFETFNKKLLDKSMALSDKAHYKHGESESALFVEDSFALSCLPEKPFDCATYVTRKANKQGKICLGGVHYYSTDPAYAGSELIVALRAYTVTVYDERGKKICEHIRAYGCVPSDTENPASQLPLLCLKSNGWQNSHVRASLSDELREYIDNLDDENLKGVLRILRDECANTGWEAAKEAAEIAYQTTRRLDSASVAAAAARLLSGLESISYDEPVDLVVYDAAFEDLR